MKLYFRNFLSVFALLVALPAGALPKVTCYGWMYQPNTEEITRVPLKLSNYDPMWYEAEIQNYGLGADYSYLPENGVGLIIYNLTSDRSTSLTAGFRRIGTTKQMEADLKYYDFNAAGEKVIVTIQCSYTEP